MSITLTPRQEKMVQLLPAVDSVADIGCDHGRLAVYLLLEGLVKRVIASDISAPSLQKAAELAQKAGVTNCISLRCGDGLEVLDENEVQAVIVAGMGAKTIIQILESKTLAEDIFYILQPNKEAPLLRYYLTHNGYRILNEVLAQEGRRVYELILVKRGEQEPLQEYDIPQMPLQRKDKELFPFLNRQAGIIQKALSQAEKSKSEQKEEISKLRTKLEKYNEVIQWLQSEK